MEILKNIIGMIHTLAASVSIIAGAYVLLKIKGDTKHKEWGKCYFYAMLLNNLSALLIFRSFGYWFFPHSLAVVALAFLIPGYFVLRIKNFRAGIFVHIFCFVISYYLLIGGAVNEAFLRIPSLQKYDVGSPVNGMTHFAAMIYFIILLIFYLVKYRKFKLNG